MAPSIKSAQNADSRRSSLVADAPDGYHTPRRTHSTTSSMFSFAFPDRPIRDAADEEKYGVVVYDPLERKLLIETKEKLQTMGDSVKCPIRGTDTKVSVYMETGPAEKKAKIFIATVDLGRLGKFVKTQRKKKRMQHLYVLGQMPMGFAPVAEEEVSE